MKKKIILSITILILGLWSYFSTSFGMKNYEEVEEMSEKVAETKQELTEAVDIDDTVDTDNIDNSDKENTDIDERIESTATDTNELLGVLTKRVGQQFSVGDLNNLLQSIFRQYNKIFILSSDLTNKDLDKTQTITVDDDGIIYEINYDIVDMDSGIVQLVSINRKEM